MEDFELRSDRLLFKWINLTRVQRTQNVARVKMGGEEATEIYR